MELQTIGGANIDKVRFCERLMSQAKLLSESIGLSQAHKTKAIEQLNVRLVAWLCKKGKDFWKS